MSKLLYISDCFYPESIGGAELVDDTIIKATGAIPVKSRDIDIISSNDFLIISNISLMEDEQVQKIENHPNYIIIEHDYKIVKSRWPWVYDGCIVPEKDRINYNLYKNAKAVFVQTTDHLNCFKLNNVVANFINLNCSIWASTELDHLRELIQLKNITNYKMAIINSSNWIKNTKGAIDFCQTNSIDYELIESASWQVLMLNLSKFSTLVFFPIARESCCRLVVEARCLDLNVITQKNYGAVLEPWFKMHGIELINFLQDSSIKNLKLIGDYIKC